MRFFISTIIVLLSFASCSSTDTPFATIKGRYIGTNKERKEIHLCKVEHGQRTKVASSSIGEAGYFAFTHYIENPSLYVINVAIAENGKPVHRDHNLKRFFLEAGTEIGIELNDGSYQLIDTNNDKNHLLTAWNLQVDTVFSYSHGFSYTHATYKNFFPLLPGYVEEAQTFKKNIASGDASFDELMELIVDIDLSNAALTFLYSLRQEHPKPEDYPPFYQEILENNKMKSPRLLELPEAINYMRSFTMFSIMSRKKNLERTEVLYHALELIPNDLLKGYYAMDNLSFFRAYDDEFIKFKETISPYLQNDYLKEKLKAYEVSIRKFEKGATAFDFAGKDLTGKEYKLSDFKGTVVYVDVWATWCGPCKAQIPALKVLEKKFHGEPITFLSISIDKPKDKQKWIDFVKEKGLGGVQLMADKAFESDVTRAYGIKGIPRFMAFDKEGKVITTDAPRPTAKKTEAWLESLL